MKPLSSNTNCGLDPKRQVECIANIFPTCLKWMEMEHIQRDLPSIFHNALNWARADAGDGSSGGGQQWAYAFTQQSESDA